jgi:hypothetical protein
MVKQGFHSGLSNTKGDQLACWWNLNTWDMGEGK